MYNELLQRIATKSEPGSETAMRLAKFGDWVVTVGDDYFIVYNEPEGYEIDAARLYEDDWFVHIRGKAWFSSKCEHDFAEARRYTLRILSELKRLKLR